MVGHDEAGSAADAGEPDDEPGGETRRARTHDVVGELGLRIAAGGRYEPGRVVTIQQVVEDHRVTRAMAREILQILAEKKLVELTPRVGAKVQDMTVWNLFDPDVIAWRLAATPSAHHQSLSELRAFVEPEAAFLAATRAPAGISRELLSQYRLLEEAGADQYFGTDRRIREQYRAADEKFHTALLVGSQNEMFAALVHPAVTALNHRIERYDGWRPRRQLDTGRITPFPARPEPLALALHGALAYAVDQKLPAAARAFARAILAEIRHGVLDADDGLHRDLAQALDHLEPRLMVPAEFETIATEIGALVAAHRLRRVAAGPPIVVMGVAGSGKSTVGELLARRLQAPFVEGDSRHPAANVAKMAAGEPLTDEDRHPWLDDLNALLRAAPGCVVVACSALKREYRERLDHLPGPDGTPGRLGVRFVYLHLDPATAEARVAGRAAHFMRSTLVPSQFATLERLEVDESGVRIDATRPADEIVTAAIEGLGRLENPGRIGFFGWV